MKTRLSLIGLLALLGSGHFLIAQPAGDPASGALEPQPLSTDSSGPERAARSDAVINPRESLEPPTENPFSFQYLRLVAEDVKETFSSPAHWDKADWLTFSGVAAAFVTVGVFDREIQRAVQDIRSDTLDDVLDGFEPFGGEYSFGLLGGFYVGGLLFRDERAKATAMDGLSAAVISGLLVTEPLKFVVGRTRPTQSDSPYQFSPFGSRKSFPSGETTQAFAVATVIAEHYDSVWVKAASYSVAGLVGFARIERNAHWATDVLAGAAIGTFVGHVVVHFNQQQRALRIEPVLSPTAQALSLSFSF